MRKIIISLLFVCFVFAKGHIFSDFNKGLTFAKNSNKPIALFLISSTCPHCHSLLKKIQQNKAFIQYVGNNFAWIVIDVSRQKTPVAFDGSVPTIMILDSNRNIIASPIKGDIPLDNLYEYLKESRILFYNSQTTIYTNIR